MIEDLLHIATILLNYIPQSNFNEEEYKQVLNTVRKIAFTLLVELREREGEK